MKRVTIPKDSVLPLVLMAITSVLITVTGLLTPSEFVNVVPLYISLAVALLQSRVSRVAFLLGGVNSVLYAIVYFHFRLYANALYALLFSCTIQLVTYFLWKRRPVGRATVFRRMSWRIRALCALGFAAVCAAGSFIQMRFTDSAQPLLDTGVSLLGIAVSVLTMLAFIEYVPLMIVSQLLNIMLYIAMLREPDGSKVLPFLVFSCYSLFCQFIALRRVVALYRAQQDGGTPEKT